MTVEKWRSVVKCIRFLIPWSLRPIYVHLQIHHCFLSGWLPQWWVWYLVTDHQTPYRRRRSLLLLSAIRKNLLRSNISSLISPSPLYCALIRGDCPSEWGEGLWGKAVTLSVKLFQVQISQKALRGVLGFHTNKQTQLCRVHTNATCLFVIQ